MQQRNSPLRCSGFGLLDIPWGFIFVADQLRCLLQLVSITRVSIPLVVLFSKVEIAKIVSLASFSGKDWSTMHEGIGVGLLRTINS